MYAVYVNHFGCLDSRDGCCFGRRGGPKDDLGGNPGQATLITHRNKMSWYSILFTSL